MISFTAFSQILLRRFGMICFSSVKRFCKSFTKRWKGYHFKVVLDINIEKALPVLISLIISNEERTPFKDRILPEARVLSSIQTQVTDMLTVCQIEDLARRVLVYLEMVQIDHHQEAHIHLMVVLIPGVVMGHLVHLVPIIKAIYHGKEEIEIRVDNGEETQGCSRADNLKIFHRICCTI